MWPHGLPSVRRSASRNARSARQRGPKRRQPTPAQGQLSRLQASHVIPLAGGPGERHHFGRRRGQCKDPAKHSGTYNGTHTALLCSCPPPLWWGCRDLLQWSGLHIGGWCLGALVDWFHYPVDGYLPLGFQAESVLRPSSSLAGNTPGCLRLPVGSDNSGNVFSLLTSKKPHSSAVLMELAAAAS